MSLANLKTFPDVSDPSAVNAAVKVVERKLSSLGLNLLINNVGIYSPTASLDTIGAEDMAFLPLLKKAAQESPEKGLSCSKAVIINISAALGSIKRTPKTFFKPVISYCCSKAALNMLAKRQGLT